VILRLKIIAFLAWKIDGFMAKCFDFIKQGLAQSKNAFLPHIMAFLKALKQADLETSTNLILENRIPCLLIQYLDNPHVISFLTEFITNKPAFFPIKKHDEVLNYMIKR